MICWIQALPNMFLAQCRMNQIVSSITPEWMHIRFEHFSIQNPENNKLQSSELESIRLWGREFQAGFASNAELAVENHLSNALWNSSMDSYENRYLQLRIRWIISSKASSWIRFKFDNVQLRTNEACGFTLDSHQASSFFNENQSDNRL